MTAPLETLERELLRLPEESREHLANTLLDSLPALAHDEFSEEQLLEFARRSAEVSSGTADLVSYEEVLREVQNALHRA